MVIILRIRTILGGTVVQGGGVNDLYFSQFGEESAQAAVTAVRNAWAGWSGSSSRWSAAWDTEQAIIDTSTGEIQDYVNVIPPAPLNPSSSTQPVAKATQMLVRFTTAAVRNGRRVRGRAFLPGLDGNAAADGRPNTTALNAANAFVAPLAALDATNQQVIYSRPSLVSPTGASSFVTGRSVWTEFAVLKSRRD